MSQTTSDSLIQAELDFEAAKSCDLQQEREKAIDLFQKAMQGFEENQSWEKFMNASVELLDVTDMFWELPLIAQFLQKIFDIYKEHQLHFPKIKAQLFLTKANILHLESKFEEALQCLEEAEQGLEKEQIGGELFYYRT